MTHEVSAEGTKDMAALLKLHDLACLLTEDSGNDERYINFAGGRIFGVTDINQGQTRVIGTVHPFSGEGTLHMFDEDDIDADDFLGSWRVTEAEAGQGIKTAVFNLDDARYELRYQVERNPFG
jgi:hypothetical protein